MSTTLQETTCETATHKRSAHGRLVQFRWLKEGHLSLGLDRNMNEVSHLKPPRRDYRSAQRVFSRTTVLLSAGRRVLLGVVVVVCWWGGLRRVLRLRDTVCVCQSVSSGGIDWRVCTHAHERVLTQHAHIDSGAATFAFILDLWILLNHVICRQRAHISSAHTCVRVHAKRPVRAFHWINTKRRCVSRTIQTAPFRNLKCLKN